MQSHEYLALPAPSSSPKVKGLKTQPERFAHQVTSLLNEMAAEGWEFWRTESLPSEERKGLTGKQTVQNCLLIFRRPSAEALAEHFAQSEATPAAPAAPAARSEPEEATPSRRPPSDTARIHDSRREPAFLSRRTESTETE